MDSGYLSVILNSSDPGVTGTAASFFAQIPTMDLEGNWEVVLNAANFPKSTVGNSVYILSDLVKEMPIGNSMYPMLARIPPIQVSTTDPVVFELTSTVVPWKPVAQRSVGLIHVDVVESTGTPVPTGPGKFTTLELIFRRVG